jgi:3-hydroxy-D-aspartate aldolase
MIPRCPATVGQPLAAVDTPALILELDAYTRNLERMATLVGASGLRFRPHAKTHKSPLIALDQIAHGAVGVFCQTVAEAEVLAQGSVRNILGGKDRTPGGIGALDPPGGLRGQRRQYR